MKRSWNWSPLGVAILLIASTVALRGPWLHHAIWTLDEGATFTMAQQVLEGEVVYRDAADHRSPLVPYLKAVIFAVAGDWNASAVYWVIAFALGGCAVLIAGIARRFTDGITGTVAGATFVVLQFFFIDSLDMMSANTEWFVVIFGVAGFTLFVSALPEHRMGRGTLAGLCFGASVLCKQPGLLDFVAVTVVMLISALPTSAHRVKLAKLWASIAAGVALPLVFTVLYFVLNSAYEDYIYYAFTFNTTVYVPEVPLTERLLAIRRPLLMAWQHVPALAGLGLIGFVVALWMGIRGLFRPPVSLQCFPWLALGWTVSGLLSTTLSGREFAHYSVQLIPGFALLVAFAIAGFRTWPLPRVRRWGPWIGLVLAITVLIQCGYRYSLIARDLDAGVETGPPELAQTIKHYSTADERILVWGYYPELYFYSQRLPATRFIYVNFITGMIAWTNIDSLQDTANGVVPGGWDRFYEDFADRPPAVIVDTGYIRTQVKFPLSAQEPLWHKIQTHYAEVAPSDNPAQVRFFRRFTDAAPPPASPAPVDERLILSGFAPSLETEPPRIEVHGPDGFDQLELWRDDTVVAVLPYRATEPISVRFFVPNEPLAPAHYSVRATGPTGSIQSAPFDFATFTRQHLASAPREPAFEIGDHRLPPKVLSTSITALAPHEAIPGTWELHAPARLLYDCPPGVPRITFTHGLKSSVVHFSDGYDLVLTWVSDDGSRTPVWQKRITPRKGAVFHLTQQEEIDLPPHEGGQLEFRFYSGEISDTHNDNLFFGHLRGQSPGPVIALGETLTLPSPESYSGIGALIRDPSGFWITNVPTRIKWPRPPNLMSLSFNYGIRPEAYAPDGDSHSNGVLFKLELLPADESPPQVLFERLLEPFNHPDHRGSQSARVEIPPGVAGELIFSTGPGWNEDASWDWAWLDSIAADAPGPPLVISPQRRLVPIQTRGFNEGWADRTDENRWGAQSPQVLTYPKPADLAAITLSYGLNDNAAADETGRRRSDGVVVVVVFIDASGSTRELFRHALDPFNRPADFGFKTSTVPVPLGETGRLELRMEPGPHGDNSFDWAYWGPLTGQVQTVDP